MTPPVSVQLYSLRDAIAAQGAEPVLSKLVEAGYAYVESFGGLDQAEIARACRAVGLQPMALHIAAPVGDSEAPSLAAAEALGVTRIVEPWRSPDLFASADGIKSVADYLNAGAQVAARHGLQLLYHNHWAEFQMHGDRHATAILLDHLDPAVMLEVDTYWVQVGGQNPAAVVAELGARAPLLHIKDGPALSPAEPMVAVGEGAVDVPAVVAAGAPHTEYLIVELDHCATDMLEAVVKSLHYLTSNGLGHGR